MKAKINKYLTTKNIKRRRRIDELMIMAAIVGIAGTLIVFNSYASKKIETQNPGSYGFAKLLAQQNSNYSNITKTKSSTNADIYNLKKNSSISVPFTLPSTKFCVYGWDRQNADLHIGFSNIPSALIKIEDNLGSDYPLTNDNSRILECYDTSKYQSTKGSLIISSNGNVWLDKIVTE